MLNLFPKGRGTCLVSFRGPKYMLSPRAGAKVQDQPTCGGQGTCSVCFRGPGHKLSLSPGARAHAQPTCGGQGTSSVHLRDPGTCSVCFHGPGHMLSLFPWARAHAQPTCRGQGISSAHLRGSCRFILWPCTWSLRSTYKAPPAAPTCSTPSTRPPRCCTLPAWPAGRRTERRTGPLRSVHLRACVRGPGAVSPMCARMRCAVVQLL